MSLSSSIPELPPIKQPKKHTLNLEKANDQLVKNYLSCHDTGKSSIVYKITEKSIENQNQDELIKVLKTNTTGRNYVIKKEQDLVKNHRNQLPPPSANVEFRSVDLWRRNVYPYSIEDPNEDGILRVRSEFSFYHEEVAGPARVLTKSDDIQWMELDFCPEPDNAINYILQQRIKFGWNIKLPVNGANIRHWMDKYQHRADSNLKKTLDDNGEFHYCLCISDIKENILYAPYELRLTSVDEAKKYPVYYTVSSSYVTKVFSSGFDVEVESQITPVMLWLWEKRLFDQLRNIRVFSLFRKRRTFRCWLVHIRNSKQLRATKFLQRRLFTANEVFQSVLLHVRSLTERASSSIDGVGVGEQAIIMVKFDPYEVYELECFMKIQDEQIGSALDKLKRLKSEIIKLTYISCITVGELEGIDFDAFFDCDNFSHEQAAIDNYLEQRQTKTSKMRDFNANFNKPLQKEQGPSYAKRKEWRFILRRICQFLRSVDYLIQELLHRIVKTSVKLLSDYVHKSTNTVHQPETSTKKQKYHSESLLSDEFTDSSSNLNQSTLLQSMNTFHNTLPIIKSGHTTAAGITHQNTMNIYEPSPVIIRTVHDIEKILEDIKQQSVVVAKPIEPIFNIYLNLNIEQHELMNKNAENNLQDDDDINNGPDELENNLNENSQASEEFEIDVSVSLSPKETEFKNYFRDLIDKYEQTVGQIQTLLYEPVFELFYETPIYELSRLQRQDRLQMNIADIVPLGDNSKKEDRLPWPEVEYLFGEDENYTDIVAEIMRNVGLSISGVSQYALTYQRYCQMVASTIKLNIDKTLRNKALGPDDFRFLLTKHTEQINSMTEMTVNRRVNFYNFKAHQFQKDVLPYPNFIISAIDKFMPNMAISRNEKLQETMRDALKMLDRDPASVEDFIEHLAVLTRINNDLPNLESEFQTITRLFAIANEANLFIDPEQYAFFKSLGSIFHHLKSSLLYTEAQCEENIRKFTVDLQFLMNKVRSESVELKIRLQSPLLLAADTTFQLANENLTLFQEIIENLLVKAKNYGSYQEKFGNTMKQVKKKVIQNELLQSDYSSGSGRGILQLQAELNELEHDINLRRLLWKSIEEWDLLIKEWLKKLLDDIVVEIVQKDVNRFTQNIYLLEKGLPANDLVPRLKNKVLDFKKALPIIIALRNPNLKTRHYQQLRQLTYLDLTQGRGIITMSVILETDVLQYREKITDISALATNEATLETMLNKIIDTWKKTDLRLVKDHSRDTFIITATDEIQILLEESQVTMATIKSSRYVAPIKVLVDDWDRRLTLFSKTLDEWILCQKRWLYLKQIFSTQDIQRQLVAEAKIFNTIEKFWKDLMRRTDDKPNAIRAATAPNLFESLQSYAVQMEKIQRSLEDYFETKRLIFPRLYFLSNEDLLEILSQSKDPQKIQPHLNKCFGNVNGLEISGKLMEVSHLISIEGEHLELSKSIRIRGAAEQWLGALEHSMYDGLKKHLKTGISDFTAIPYKDWILKQAGQIVLLVSQINFNKQVITCFESSNPTASLTAYQVDLISSINLAASVISKELTNYKTLTVEALLTIEVHSRDTLSALIDNKISRANDFEWMRQLRYTYDEQSAHLLFVQQSDSNFIYGYEYLGCSPRLVITPLTDRCYLTLTGALRLNLGGAPAGPAGTGKTETVKDLAKSIGKLCLVFNCSEGLDYKMLGKFFSGLAQSGSWCCFDEFNRIDIEVLSVVAQQMLTIKTAKDSQYPRFLFEGREIKLNPTCGIFITMNPTYAGRVELPDNLKPLYRPVAMMVPDFALISEIILFSLGFVSAKNLATKIVTLYHLASRQLSHQDHYDFGLRTVKAVLLMAGQVKKNFIIDQQRVGNISEVEEAQVLMQALYDTNLPKFLKDDVLLFQNLMNDLFPNLKKLNKNMEAIEKSINLAINELQLQHWPSQTAKIMQLYDQMLVRHGIMLVGPTGGGKTVARNILQKALQLLPTCTPKRENEGVTIGEKQTKSLHGIDENEFNETESVKKSVKSDSQSTLTTPMIPIDQSPRSVVTNDNNFIDVGRLNYLLGILKNRKARIESLTISAKSIEIGELYGYIDPMTLEWCDGVFGNAIRAFSTTASAATDPDSENGIVWQFTILDGPVDTFWVENLNSVLDDSKVLCLSNGERINLTPTIRIVFEVDSLLHVSPATVSRCAMVYFDPSDLGLKPWIENWFSTLPSAFPKHGKDYLHELLTLSLDKGFSFIEKRKGSTSFPFIKQNVLNTMFSLIGAFIEFFGRNGGYGEIEGVSQQQPATVQQNGSKKAPTNKKRKAKNDLSAVELNKIQYFIQRNPKQLQTIISKIYIFAFIWGFGGCLKREDNAEDDNVINQKSHVKTNMDSLTNEFDEFVHEIFGSNIKYSIYCPPTSKPVFDYFLDVATGNFVEWTQLLPNIESLIRKRTTEGITETIDSVRYSFLASLLLMNKKSVLITGSSGIGKTVIIKSMLKSLTASGFSYKINSILGDIFNYSEKKNLITQNAVANLFDQEAENKKNRVEEFGVATNLMQFSAQTSSNKFLSMFTSKLVKKSQSLLGAPRNKQIINFIDDLNIPIADKFGDQAPLEMLRFIIENRSFHDIKACQTKNITDCSFIVCCNPPSAGRNQLSPRLVRQLCILSMPDPSAKSLFNIYQVQLGRFFGENEFNNEIKSNLVPLVSSCIVIYYRVFINMLPTPSKSHYVFNFRDLSKLNNGLMQANALVVVNKDHLVNLFAHECVRVFSDRLTTDADNEIFYDHLIYTISDYFKTELQNPYRRQPILKAKENEETEAAASEPNENSELVLYGDFIKNDERIYQPLRNWRQLISVLSEYQMRSNMAGHVSKQIVFFKEAVEHICRACRVLRQPGGHLLLIGLDGTGKNTILELSAFISNCEMMKLNVKKGYSYADFREDLKGVFKVTGIKQRRIVLFIADKDISEELFLEDLDSMLTSGNIPDLFDADELDGVFMEIKQDALMDGISEDKAELYKYLINRVQANLHIVLSMSPVGTKFRERCRFHPAIINCTTIDWYNDWSEEAMQQVSMSFLESLDLSIATQLSPVQQEAEKLKISQVCVYMHMSLIKASMKFYYEHKRYYYVTPSCYIDLLRTFTKMFESKKTEYIESLARLRTGLKKLSDANQLVAVMKKELIALGPQIEIKTKETEELMVKLEKDQLAVNEVASIVAAEEEKMSRETEMVRQYAREAEKDLDDVIPILANAREALSAMNKADISEIRVFVNPPFLVMTVMSAVNICLSEKADWATAKTVLGDPSFINRLINYDVESFNEKTYAKLKQYSKNPDFVPDTVSKVSRACKSLCSWVLAVQKFYEVYRQVKPKKNKVKEANEALDVMVKGLTKKQKMLELIQQHLDNLKKKYSESMQEKQSLENRTELMKLRMVRAFELTTALGTEKIRWSEQYEELKQKADLITGISLISSGTVNYLGAMTQDYRTMLVNEWLVFCKENAELLVESNFDLTKSVVEQHVIRNWINQQLPDDQNSIENAIFLKYSLKWPLIIDPQNQVVRWIKEMEGDALKICKSEDPLIFRTLEGAIRLGQAVLIENINENLDPLLDPILRKEVVTRGAQKILKLGDVEVEYNESFRLYLVTSLSNPHYLPSAFIKVNLINFTITFKCLFEQFLSLVVLKERPELEKERSQLLETIAKDFMTLRNLEDKSLSILSQTQTDELDEDDDEHDQMSIGLSDKKTLLDDQNLIDVLKRSKETSTDISFRLKKNEETEKSLNLARQKYSAIATRASILYFSVENLTQLNVMYQFSLAWFYSVFQSCLVMKPETTGGGLWKLLLAAPHQDSVSSIDGGKDFFSSSKCDLLEEEELQKCEEDTGDKENPNQPGYALDTDTKIQVDRRNSLLSGLSGLMTSRSEDIHDDLTTNSYYSIRNLEQNPNQQSLADILAVENERSSKQEEAEFKSHVNQIITTLTQTVYQVVSWAMFAEHKLIFSFSICVNILKHKGQQILEQHISESEYNFFLNSTLLSDMQLDTLNEKIQELKEYTFPTDLLVDDKILRQLMLLEDTLPEKFTGLCKNMEANLTELWHGFMNSNDPYDFTIIAENEKFFSFSSLTKFQKLILIKLLRPDSLITAVNHFIHEILGAKFLNANVPTLRELYIQSLAHTPIIFILSPGSDPTNQLLRFARESRGSALHLDIVSLGKGQGPKAEELISKSLMLKGRWVFLQNCHLAASFMPRLQVIVNNLSRSGVEIDKQFRLFLSSKPDNSFPISLLKAGIKMTIESPRGLKNNLKQNFGPGGFINAKIFDSDNFGSNWKRLLFSLGFIHALIHERKKFGPLGWNLPYEFNSSDFEVAVLQLQSLLTDKNSENIPFNDLKYITGEVIYGGRVTDDYDRRCLLSMLNNFFCRGAISEEHYYGDNNTYAAPEKDLDYAGILEFIDELPDDDDPSIFGMNVYAQKMLLSSQGDQLIGAILSMEPVKQSKSIGDSTRIENGKLDSDIVMDMCTDIIKLLPQKVVPQFSKGRHLKLPEALEKLKSKLGSAYYENSAMNTVLVQELSRYDKLLSTIFKTIEELMKALRGEIMISKDSENIYASFLSQKIPNCWQSVSYPSQKPLGFWIKNLLKRTIFFSNWSKTMIEFVENKSPVMNPYSIWLSGFFFPQGLLAAISQNYARKYMTSIDALEFKYTVLNDTYEESPDMDVDKLFENNEKFNLNGQDGVILGGFFLDGGKWMRDGNFPLDSPVRFTTLPHFLCQLVRKEVVQVLSSGVRVEPTIREEDEDEDEGQLSSRTNQSSKIRNKYRCPVYRNSIRAGNSNDQSKNFITTIELDCREDPQFWILRGLCIILQNDD